jgi:hypothetical protein
VANYLWLLNDGSSRILLNNGTDKLALNEEVPAEVYGWQPPLSEPSRHIRRAVAVVAALAGAVGPAYTPTAGDATVAFASTSPQIVNKTVIYEDRTSYSETPVAAETVTVDKWYAPLDTPVRRKAAPYTDYVFGYYPVAVPGDADLAFAATSPQIVSRTIVYESDAYAPYTPVSELVTVDKWWQQLDVPVLKRLSVAAYPTIRLDPQPVVPWDWRPALNEPHRLKKLPAGGYQFEARASFPQVPWGWYAKLDEPLRVAKSPAKQVSLTFLAAAPSNAVEQNWFIPLDIPTRARKLNEFPATAIPVYFTPATPGAGNEYNWFESLNSPHRLRPSIRAAQQQSLTVPSRLITTTLEYAWYQPLTTPTRLDWLNRSDDAQGNVNPIVPYAFQQLDTPTRRLRSVYTAPGEAPYQVETVTIDKWWRELGRPAYTKRIDRPALALGNINPIVPIAWHQLHSPHRLKGRISYPFEARAIYPLAFPGNGNGTTQPWPALSEPVRLKSYYHQPNAGLVWTTSFVLPAYDPDRIVFVRFEQRTISACEDREASTGEYPRIVYAID